MRVITVAFCAFIFSNLAGCTSSSHVLTGTARNPIAIEQVSVYREPPDNFQEIAILTSSSEWSAAVTEQGRMNAVIEGLKEEAAALGANGVLLTGFGSTTETHGSSSYGSGYGSGYVSSSTNKTGEALAIYVQPPELTE